MGVLGLGFYFLTSCSRGCRDQWLEEIAVNVLWLVTQSVYMSLISLTHPCLFFVINNIYTCFLLYPLKSFGFQLSFQISFTRNWEFNCLLHKGSTQRKPLLRAVSFSYGTHEDSSCSTQGNSLIKDVHYRTIVLSWTHESWSLMKVRICYKLNVSQTWIYVFTLVISLDVQ